MSNQKLIWSLIGLVVVLIIIFFLTKESPVEEIIPEPEIEVVEVPEVIEPKTKNKIIGTSVEGRDIESLTYGNGSTTVIFVGGIHGGYEWNSSLLAYDFVDYLDAGNLQIPENLKVIVVPTLNPDGHFSVVKKDGPFLIAEIPENDAHTTGKGRFNANNVDLNRNFDCKWQPISSWRGKTVDAGTAAFSEPEAAALRDLVLRENPVAVIFWHSQANAVYASECESGVLPATLTLMNTYATAASYKAVSSFDAYPVTGDAEGWLASIGIPAITVELEGRVTPEWERNISGIKAVLNLYGI